MRLASHVDCDMIMRRRVEVRLRSSREEGEDLGGGRVHELCQGRVALLEEDDAQTDGIVGKRGGKGGILERNGVSYTLRCAYTVCKAL